jgi:hypothetical protein
MNSKCVANVLLMCFVRRANGNTRERLMMVGRSNVLLMCC